MSLRELTITAVILLGGSSCDSEFGPDPSVGRLDPERVATSDGRDIEVHGQNFWLRLRARFDDPNSSTLRGTYSVSLQRQGSTDPAQVAPATRVSELLVKFARPAELLPGDYEVTLIDPFGRAAVAPRPLTIGGDQVVIEDLPGGAGRAVGALTRSVDAPALRVYAIRRTSSGAFVADQPVTWALTAALGALTPGLGGTAATFVPSTIGATRIVANPSDPAVAAGQTGDITVTAAAVLHLAFVTAPQTIAAANCSGAVVVEVRDANDNPVSFATQVTLSASPPAGFAFFSDPGCALPEASVSVAPNASRARSYLRGTSPVTATLTASASGLASATQAVVITAPPTRAVALGFATGPQTIAAGACSAGVIVETRDAMGTPTAVSTATNVGLSSTPATLSLFRDASCTVSLSVVTVPVNASSATFFFKAMAAGSATLTAAASGFTDATQIEVIKAGPAATLTVLNFPSPTTAGVPGAFSVTARDAFNNLVTDYVGTVGFTSSDGQAMLPGPVAFVLADSGSRLFSATLKTAGLQSLIATDGMGATGSQTGIVVNAGPATRLVFTTPPRTFVVGACPGAGKAITVELRDDFANPVNAAAGGQRFTASSSSTGATTWYLDGACAAVATGGAFTLAAGLSSVNLLYKDTAVGAPSVALTNSSLLINPAPQVESVVSGGAIVGSPPTAKFTVSPAAIVVGQSVTFDASSSSDYQTLPAGLLVSWDFTGAAAGPALWTAWNSVKTASFVYSVAGTFAPRLAVQDTDGNITYTTRTVIVVGSATDLFVVTTPTALDDGATDCTSALGADGKLSIFEAIRLSNATPNRQAITFSGPMTITAPAPATAPYLDLSAPADLVGSTGVVINGYPIRVGAGVNALISGIEITGQTLRNELIGTAILRDVYVHDTFGLKVDGFTTLTRVELAACANFCVHVAATTAMVRVEYSILRDTPSLTAITLSNCGTPALDVQSSVLVHLGTAIGMTGSCTGAVLVNNNTFHANGTGLVLKGSGHVVRNNIFSSHTITAASCGTATFSSRAYHLLFSNAGNGCLATDTNTLTTNPLYLVPAADDYRLDAASPARDSALDVGLDLNGVAPGNFTGIGPDRGGNETW